MVRIKYNKERSGKQIGGGGPRDRQRVLEEKQLLERLKPAIHAEVAKSEAGTPTDLSQHLPLKVVRKKIEEAVVATKEAERKRYNSGLRNINDQLNASKKQKAAVEDQLIDANAEIRRLKSQVSSAPIVSEEAKAKINEKKLEISKLQTELSVKEKNYIRYEKEITELKAEMGDRWSELADKDRELDELKSNTSEEIHSRDITIAKLESGIKSKEEADARSEKLSRDLQNKLDKLYNKIADGSIQPLVGSKMKRPELEDKIFIDPIDKSKEPKLDSHIDIKEEEPKEEKRDMKTDLSKLRKLLDM